MHVQPASSFLI